MSGPAPAATSIPVVFVADASAAAASSVLRPMVAVLPDHDGWNDYGRRFFAKAMILGPDENMTINIRLMFSQHEDTGVFLLNLFKDRGQVVPVEEVSAPRCFARSGIAISGPAAQEKTTG
jgi:hypothetical protein